MISTKGYAARDAVSPLGPFGFDRRDPGPRDVLIDIKYCGICHSDIHQVRSGWGPSTYPMVPGHEIAGIVAKVGSAVRRFKVGDRVGVGCFVDSCRACAPCQAGLEQYCEQGMTLTYNHKERDGITPTQGGYSDRIVVNEDYVLRIPDSLPLDGAAPLLCAGITVYSPLRHWKAGPGKKVAVMGLGGLGHMAVKFACAFGCHVTVLSQSLRKEADARRMGADDVLATSDPETFRKLRSKFDLIINTVSGDIDWNQYLNMLRLDGAMVLVGLPESKASIGPFSLVTNRRSLCGSGIGGIKETQEMLEICGEHEIACDVEVIPIQKVNEAYERVLQSDVRYRFVIDLASLKSL
jgi:uncharacterized zinc-type alcohol dehydrogenase-like protein